MTNQTIRKMNAIKTILDIAHDAGIDKVEFHLRDIIDEEVREIAKNENANFYPPRPDSPSYWCALHKGQHRIYVRGKEKEVRYVEQ